MTPANGLMAPSASHSVLHVGGGQIDNNSLRSILPREEWHVHDEPAVASAATLLKRSKFELVLCNQELTGGSWLDIRNALMWIEEPPVLVVSSYAADERFWAEALNLGAYDVLAKPYIGHEVSRVLTSACRFRSRRLAEQKLTVAHA